MIEFLRETIEYKNWGLNKLTVSSVGIIVFAFAEGWALFKQNQRIWQKRSGQALSVPWFTYLACFFAAALLWSIYAKSISVAFNSIVLVLLYIPILIGLWKFKGFSHHEKLQAGLFLLMIPAMFLLPWKDGMYVFFCVGALYALATQPWEMWKEKSVGVVEVRLLIVYIISSVFWVGYAFAADEIALMVTTPPALLLLILSGYLYFRYRKV